MNKNKRELCASCEQLFSVDAIMMILPASHQTKKVRFCTKAEKYDEPLLGIFSRLALHESKNWQTILPAFDEPANNKNL